LRAEPEQRVSPGQTVHLEVDPTGWRLFDASGEAIPRAVTATGNGTVEPLLPSLS
jgi:multiple sugar transport system ATP-binding protein